MAPREGNSIVKHGVLDERLNVHGVKGLKVADLSICPDNVGCNTYSTALLIGEKCAMLTAEDLGYSGRALDMKVPEYHAPRYVMFAVLSLERRTNIVVGRSPVWRVCKRTHRRAVNREEIAEDSSDGSYDSLMRNVYMMTMNVFLTLPRVHCDRVSRNSYRVMTSSKRKDAGRFASCQANQNETIALGH
jgi:hypothetical protein